jgi:hypothetical protein
MSLFRTYYDPWAEFDRLFDNAFYARFPVQSSSQQGGQVSRRDPSVFQPRYVSLFSAIVISVIKLIVPETEWTFTRTSSQTR